MHLPRTLIVAALLAGLPFADLSAQTQPPRQMEKLGRGVVAIHQPDGRVFISWRLLGTDPEGTAFNIYRTTGGSAERPDTGPFGSQQSASGGNLKLNTAPLSGATCFVDDRANLSRDTSYVVRAVVGDAEIPSDAAFTLKAGAPPLPYLTVPLTTPAGYMPGDVSTGDLDGDGEFELIVHQTGRGQDNSRGGPTDAPVLQAYKLDGTLLWTINLGKNIREGAHYTQFMVYDLDGDGRAEIACKTADGTVDGKGKVIGDANANWVQPEGATVKIKVARRGQGAGQAENTPAERTENVGGHILSGPEYFTIFDGLSGAALATTDYIPSRVRSGVELNAQELNETWGDARGNRSDRFLACIAYLDGERPSVVMCRGYYTRAVLAAWDWRDGKLTKRWVFDSDTSEENRKYRGQGDHNLSVADVDGDGRDEIVYGAAVIDDNGTGLYSTGWGHGDAMHVSDLVPSNPGIEVFNIQERFAGEGMNMRDGKTGKPIYVVPSIKADESGGDRGEGPGRGVAFNIDPRYPGNECWAAGSGMTGMYSAVGERISEKRPRSCNFAVWWDGDLLRELLDRNYIAKWNWQDGTESTLLVAQGSNSNNGTKATPALSADLLGDWREEVIWRTEDGKALRIYTTTIPTQHRIATLMHDPQYRVAIAWQNVAYNQPPHPSFYLDEAAPLPPRREIRAVGK